MKQKPLFCRHKYLDLLAAGILSYAVGLIASACDRIIAGFFCGVEGLSALAVVDPLSGIIGFLGVLLIYGLRFVYPTEMGRKNQARANEYFSSALTAAIIISVVFLIVIGAIGDAYFSFQNISGSYLSYAQDYFLCAKFVFILQPITGLIGAAIFTDGNARINRIANLTYVVANIGLSILFALNLGMLGIGLGTLVAGLCCFAIQCSHFFSKKNTLRFKPRLALRDLANMARYGIAEASYSIFSGINGIVINWLIITYLGEPYLAVHSVVGYATCLCCFFGGCQTSMVPLLNVFLGEENYDGMLKILRVALRSSIVMGLILTAVALVTAPLFPTMFSISEPELVQACIEGVRISCLSFAVTGVLGVVTRYYNALGRNILTTVLSIMKDSLIFMLLFFVCLKFGGVTGMWVCNLLNPLVAAPLFALIVFLAVGRKNPLLLPGQENTIKSWDLVLSPEAIIETRDEIADFLTQQGKEKRTVARAMFLIEEQSMMVLDNNPGKKIYLSITVIDKGTEASLIFRDTGILEDLADEEHDTQTFRAFVLSGITQRIDSKDYMKVGGYNRKEYVI